MSERKRVKTGKPSKKTPDRVAIIALAIADGATQAHAAMLAGIDPGTLSRWLSDGEAENATAEQRAVTGVINRAREKWKTDRIANIQRHEEKNWTASAWLLERRYPEEFGRQEKRPETKAPTWADILAIADGPHE